MAGLLFRIALVVTLAAPLVGVALAPTVLIHETFDEKPLVSGILRSLLGTGCRVNLPG